MISAIRINENGKLAIRRKGKWVAQHCPYREGSYCGDNCPLFGDPILNDADEGKIFSVLRLCHSHQLTFLKEEFEDAREGADASL